MSVNHTPGPYRIGRLAMNDGAVPILADEDENTVRVAPEAGT